MTRADGQRGRAGARPCVRRYWEFQDALRALAATEQYYPGDTLSLRFVLPMPTSWSGKKRRETEGQPHTVKPDLDNLIKAVKDSLLVSDSHVWRYERMEKVWGVTGAIEVLSLPEEQPHRFQLPEIDFYPANNSLEEGYRQRTVTADDLLGRSNRKKNALTDAPGVHEENSK